ncbi:MAG TPA: efflux RND transporter periplasmic adaptor subunit [Candidatus Acidoferrales bacterium]|nr:efflux RND transporter periplasmic adaptor subunit [Candidatus Acidoferrales bacterium]
MQPPVPVLVARVVEKTVPVEVRAIGTAEAYSTVSIKAQVSGEVTQVHFREGQDVRKGQLLFTIDRRPFDAALHQAEANLARDQTQEALAEVQARRYTKLFQEGVSAKEQADQMQANADALKAAVLADKAAVEYAKLQLEYCSIYSPMDGRTGSLMVHAGNLVKANDVPVLVVINQITPIYVNFSPPEDVLPQVKKYMALGRLRVEAFPPDDPRHPGVGYLSFVDNAVDNATGTVRLKGTFENTDHRLWPGEFVNVVLTVAEQPNALLVPSQAVQTGQGGQFVFVVKSDQTVESRPVVVSRILEGNAIVDRGVRLGEVVVTDGQVGLVPGARVEIKTGSQGG